MRKTALLIIYLFLSLTISLNEQEISAVGIRTASTGNENPIGLSSRQRHLRGFNDTLTVTVNSKGWTIDSIRTFQETNKSIKTDSGTFRIPFETKMHYLSKRDKRIIEKGNPFEGEFGWLALSVNDNSIAFTSTALYFSNRRNATIYLHKGNYADSIYVSKGGQPIGAPLEYVLPIDLHPCDWTFPASGDTLEATTKGTTWWIKEIGIKDEKYNGVRAFRPAWRDDTPKWKETIEWITVETEGKEVKIIISPNTTGKRREFFIELKCNYSEDGQYKNYSEHFRGKQE